MTQKRTSGSRVFGWWLIGMVLTAAPIAGALCAAQSIQEYKGLALAPDGKRLAVVDPGTALEAEPHGSVVIRKTDTFCRALPRASANSPGLRGRPTALSSRSSLATKRRKPCASRWRL